MRARLLRWAGYVSGDVAVRIILVVLAVLLAVVLFSVRQLATTSDDAKAAATAAVQAARDAERAALAADNQSSVNKDIILRLTEAARLSESNRVEDQRRGRELTQQAITTVLTTLTERQVQSDTQLVALLDRVLTTLARIEHNQRRTVAQPQPAPMPPPQPSPTCVRVPAVQVCTGRRTTARGSTTTNRTARHAPDRSRRLPA